MDYEYTVREIVESAINNMPLAVSALAVHGVMTGFLDPVHRRRLNGINLVVPDGQPVRWGLKLVHKIDLPDRVYGPELTVQVIDAAGKKRIPIFLYGSTENTLELFAEKIYNLYPGLIIAGKEISKFRSLGRDEKMDLIARIKASGAKIVFVGLGCPRQEVWIYEYLNYLNMPLIAVGAAFDYHAGLLKKPPRWMQTAGLEWFYRLLQEPRRLWRRYVYLNPLFLVMLFLEYFKIYRVPVVMPDGEEPEKSYG